MSSRRQQRRNQRSQNVTSLNGLFKNSKWKELRPATASNVRPPLHHHRQPVYHTNKNLNHHNRYVYPVSVSLRGRRTDEKTNERPGNRISSPSPVHRAVVGLVGNRGVPSLQWRPGLRESKHTIARHEQSTVTLFVDNIPKGIDRGWVRRLFGRCGEVVDLFISAKTRRNNPDCFGFVRYKSVQDAQYAIEELNAHVVRGRKLRVSMAKYGKDGGAVDEGGSKGRSSENNNKAEFQKTEHGRPSNVNFANNRTPAFRDGRRYSDVVAGIRKQLEELKEEVEQKVNIIPVFKTIKVREDDETAKFLKMGIVGENSEVLNIPHIHSQIQECNVKVTGILYLSPTKLLLVFDCEIDANNAVVCDSPLWNIFDNIRLWCEGDFFDDRVVWIECFGVHPLCCSKTNLKSIGELWGPVIHIENKVQGIENITGARLLIRTKAQNKIDSRVRLVYDHGSCDVWVKEVYGGCTKTCGYGNEKMVRSELQQVHNVEQGTGNHSLGYTKNSKFDDPLVQEMVVNPIERECQSWVDPIVSNENIYWSDVESAASGFSRQELNSPIMSPSRASKSSRPRGRPKKNSERGLVEARKTWETAQMLGITVDDENAVLSGLRKSKRILILEEKGE